MQGHQTVRLSTPFYMGLFDEQEPYLTKYGLHEPPYSTKPNDRFLYLTPPHKEAVAMVAQAIREREGAVLIYGAFGTGKTSLMQLLHTELRARPKEFRVGVIENAGSCPTEFQLAQEVIECFGGKSLYNYRKGRNDQIKQMLYENHQHGVISVLLIDEAHEFPARVFEALRGYLNFETSTEKLLQIILFAQPPIIRKLAYAKAFRDRLWRSELRAMTRNEMAEMLRWRFQQAGGKTFPFQENTIDHLFELTKGHPRSTCGLSHLALKLAALGNGLVTPDIINEVKDKRFIGGTYE